MFNAPLRHLYHTTNLSGCLCTETGQTCRPHAVEATATTRARTRARCPSRGFAAQQSGSHLVPEEEIRLTELKLLDVEGLHERKSHDVEA